MTKLEILQRMECIVQAVAWAIQDGEPLYLERVLAELRQAMKGEQG
jgi:hypothetical protein